MATLIMPPTYNPPLVLTILGTIFIGLALLVALWILFDMIFRKGWRSMMAVMLVKIADSPLVPLLYVLTQYAVGFQSMY